MTEKNSGVALTGTDTDLLKMEYQALASYDATVASTLTASGTIGLTLIIFVLTRPQLLFVDLPDAYRLALPLAPLAYFAFIVHVNNLITLRAKQFREIERELAHRSRDHHSPERARTDEDLIDLAAVPVPSTARALVILGQPFRGTKLSLIVTAGFIGLCILVVLLVVKLVAALYSEPTVPIAIWATAFYTAAVALLIGSLI